MAATASYKHLDSKLKIAELTLGQWAALVGGFLLALGYALYLHPLGAYFTLASAIYVAGIPFCCAFISSLYGFDLWRAVRSLWRYARGERSFMPGPGGPSTGYVIGDEPDDHSARGAPELPVLLESLWD